MNNRKSTDGKEREGAAVIERRRFRRYIISGEVELRMSYLETVAELVNLGEGGLLVRGQIALPEGSLITARVKPARGPFNLEIHGEVVGGKGNLMAVRFTEAPRNINEMLCWLQMENLPWAGTLDNSEAEPMPVAQTVAASAEASPEIEREMDSVYQLA
jgi:hypothetical protein